MMMFKQMNNVRLLFYRRMDLHVPVNSHQTMNKNALVLILIRYGVTSLRHSYTTRLLVLKKSLSHIYKLKLGHCP